MTASITISKRQGWTGIPNRIFDDDRISIEAVGFLCLLLSMNEGWRFNDNDLKRRAGIGDDKLKRIKFELKEAGYLAIDRGRADDGRFFGWIWSVTDQPTETGVSRQSVEPKFGKTGVHKSTKKKEHQFEESPNIPRGDCLTSKKISAEEEQGKEKEETKGFNEFISKYPKKVDLLNAETAFGKALKQGHSPETIIQGAQKYAKYIRDSGTEDRYVLKPEKWLRKERWRDQYNDQDDNFWTGPVLTDRWYEVER